MEGYRMAEARELPVPDEADDAGEAHELVRGWLIDNRLACSLLPGAFDDPAVWGVLLADVAHHIANALAESEGADRAAVLAAIRRAFEVEMRAPTDEHTGGFVEPEKPGQA
jgi:Domain of unknown function (DUF5076)